MSIDSTTIVPANRLGQLLAEARLRTGADLQQLAERSAGHFTVGELSDLEAGHRLLDDDLIRLVTSLYEIGCGTIVPNRAELTIDLDQNIVSASGKAIRLDSTAHTHILDRYLSLLYLLRNREPGSTIPLRDEDLAILAASLAERAELIEEQLLASMAADDETVAGLMGWFKKRLWVPGAGALVGVVSIGTLVLISGDTSEAAELTNEEPDAPPRSRNLISLSPEQTKGRAAEALMPFDWQSTLPGWQVTYAGPDTGFRGLTFPYDKTIEIYVRDSDTPETVAGILAHELGHAVDVTYFDEAARAQWLDARDRPDAQWWPDAYANDFETGAGDFAESFAYWAIQDETFSRLAGTPNSEEIALIGTLVGPFLERNSKQ